MIRNIRILLYELTVHGTDEELNEAIDESTIGCLRISCLRRAKGKGSVRCVREVREVHALSLTLTHLKYWLTHFCNNLKPDGSEAESPMV